jgi:hypothetical protein
MFRNNQGSFFSLGIYSVHEFAEFLELSKDVIAQLTKHGGVWDHPPTK